MRSFYVFFLFVLIYPVGLTVGQQPVDKARQKTATAEQSADKIQKPADLLSTAGTQQQVTTSQVNFGSDDRYRIGPGDVLDIRVFNKPQFSRDAVRVDGRGMIRMPLIQREIQAACHTEAELAREITTLYLEYLRNPQVDVFIRDYQSQPVAVLGAVRVPSRFQLQRKVRLLELLSHVGGPTDNAGRVVQIVHTATTPTICEESGQPASDESEASALDNYKLSDTMMGEEKANPYVRPGDIVNIPEAEQAFVVGNVLRPAAISLKDPITVSRAIAMSGGTMPDTKSDRVRIVRQPPGSATKTEIFVDLKAIDKHKAEDVVLQAGDIVDVPTSGGKRLLRSLIGAVVPSIAQLPVRVIP
jgi:polysaccharide biosynthesis/export protein